MKITLKQIFEDTEKFFLEGHNQDEVFDYMYKKYGSVIRKNPKTWEIVNEFFSDLFD